MNITDVAAYNAVIKKEPDNQSIQIVNNETPRDVLSKVVESASGLTKRDKLDKMFVWEIHETATPFSCFTNMSWAWLFTQLSPYWKPPITDKISGTIIYDIYNETMTDVIEMI